MSEQPRTIVNNEIHVHGLMSPEQIAEEIASAMTAALEEFPEQVIAAYHDRSTGDRITAQRWDGSKESSENISRWLTRNGEQTLFDGDVLRTRNVETGDEERIIKGQWVYRTEDGRMWTCSDRHFRCSFVLGEAPRAAATDPIPVMRMLSAHLGAEKFQRLIMRQLIEDLGDRGALRLYLNVASEIDDEHA